MTKQIFIEVAAEIPHGDEFVGVITYDREEAIKIATSNWDHLSDHDKKHQSMRVDVYIVDLPDGDTRAAKEVYNDMTEADTWPYDADDVICIGPSN